MLLFDSGVEEGSAFDNRPAQRKTGTKASKCRFARFRLKRVARIKGAVLGKNECVAVSYVRPGTGDDVNRTSRGST